MILEGIAPQMQYFVSKNAEIVSDDKENAPVNTMTELRINES